MGGVTVGWVFNLHKEVPTSAPELITVAVVFPFLALLAVLIRYALRLRSKSSSLIGSDDIAVAIGWIFCVFYSTIIIYQTRWGQGINLEYFPQENIVPFGKVQYASGPVYPICLLCFKVSILALYLRIGGGIRLHRRIIYITLGVICLTQLTYAFLFCFQCNPVQKIWDMNVSGTCINQLAFLYALAATSIFFDIIILILPMPVLLGLQMSLRKRIGLCCILAIGLSITVIQIIRFFRIKNLKSYTNSASLIQWSIIEINLGIIIACTPTFGPIFRSIFDGVHSSLTYIFDSRMRSRYNSKSTSIRLNSTSGEIGRSGIAPCDGKTVTEAHRVDSLDSQRDILSPEDGVLTTRTYAVDVEVESAGKQGLPIL